MSCMDCGKSFDQAQVGRPAARCVPCRTKRHKELIRIWREAHKDHINKQAVQRRAAQGDAYRKKNRDYMRKYRGKKKIEEMLGG